MSLDFNNAGPQMDFSPMPAGTVVKVIASLRAGATGPDGALTQSRSSDALYLDMVFTVTEGPYRNRKIFQNLTVEGGKVNEQGQSIAAGISRSTIRAMLNAARNIKPDDDSERACQARTINSYRDLDNLEFPAKLGIQKGKDGYQDKNTIQQVIEPGHNDYGPLMSGQYAYPARPGGGGGTPGGFSGGAAAAAPAPKASWEHPAAPAAAAAPSSSVAPSWAG